MHETSGRATRNCKGIPFQQFSTQLPRAASTVSWKKPITVKRGKLMACHMQVVNSTPWHCYLCSVTNVGLLHMKREWQLNVMKLFQPPSSSIATAPMDAYHEKRPVRVLSLFDGIATGKVVLDQMRLVVEKYFASEIDQDAIHVAALQHGLSVTQVGPVESLTESEITKLCPIDLLIGGSPCNDLSLVNPARKGLYDPCGSGKLFFDFYRVLKALQLGNKGRHLFWMYENVASMPKEYRHIISRFLQCEPALLDGRFFSPQVRARYFWGNIPGMYLPLPSNLLEKEISLSTVLYRSLGREPVVDKIQTVTTRGNSLRQGKNNILPVLYKGQGDVLWITELERVFGFPEHYTDVGNLSLGRRQQLLGKAWSVPVVKHIFAPLRSFFNVHI